MKKNIKNKIIQIKKKISKFPNNELKYILNVIDSENNLEIYTEKLEKKFCKIFKTKFAIACNSGTSGLHASLAALNLKKSDEVIVPALTVVMDSYAAIHLNAKPIFADVDENNFWPVPFVAYLKNNIIQNLNKSPGIELLLNKEDAQYLISFNLQHFDVYRKTSGGAAAAAILVGGLLGGAMMTEECTAIIKGELIIKEIDSGDILCRYQHDISKSSEFKMGVFKPAYSDVTQQATSELVKQLIQNLIEC